MSQTTLLLLAILGDILTGIATVGSILVSAAIVLAIFAAAIYVIKDFLFPRDVDDDM